MALSRITGDEELYVGGVFALRRAEALRERNVTHILSVINYSLEKYSELGGGRYVHLSVDVDDDEDVDLLMHFPRLVRFIEAGLYPPPSAPPQDSSPDQAKRQADGYGSKGGGRDGDSITPVAPVSSERIDAKAPSDTAPAAAALTANLSISRPTPTPPFPDRRPGVYVHCAMGKSRSVSAIIAYLLWKHPSRYGSADRRNPDRSAAARAAVYRALEWVRQTREMAEPNDGFMRQLAMWWEMGCPASSDDAVERHPTYQRWLYRREVEESAKVGRAPDWIRFEDEAQEQEAEEEVKREGNEDGETGKGRSEPVVEVRCKKCRRVLATSKFLVSHTRRQQQAPGDGGRGKSRQSVPAAQQQQQKCPHIFVEPLSWMRPALEQGDLDGRLVCPNVKCGSSVGRFAWQGFKCSCGEWVCPAISLQRSKVDEATVIVAAVPSSVPPGSGVPLSSPLSSSAAVVVAAVAERRAALGIRMPPPARRENL